jgi:hypothetical protein
MDGILFLYQQLKRKNRFFRKIFRKSELLEKNLIVGRDLRCPAWLRNQILKHQMIKPRARSENKSMHVKIDGQNHNFPLYIKRIDFYRFVNQQTIILRHNTRRTIYHLYSPISFIIIIPFKTLLMSSLLSLSLGVTCLSPLRNVICTVSVFCLSLSPGVQQRIYFGIILYMIQF